MINDFSEPDRTEIGGVSDLRCSRKERRKRQWIIITLAGGNVGTRIELMSLSGIKYRVNWLWVVLISGTFHFGRCAEPPCLAFSFIGFHRGPMIDTKIWSHTVIYKDKLFRCLLQRDLLYY